MPQLLLLQMKGWHVGLWLLLSVSQAEDIGACLGCSISAVAPRLGAGLGLGNLLPSAQELRCAKVFLQSRGLLEWMAEEMRCPQREQTLLSPSSERNRSGLCSLSRRGVCCVLRLYSPEACGGGEADLGKEEILLKMSLGAIQAHCGLIHDYIIKEMVKLCGRQEPI